MTETPKPAETFGQKLERLCAEMGIALPAAGPKGARQAAPRLSGNERIDAIMRGENPDAREEPGCDG